MSAVAGGVVPAISPRCFQALGHGICAGLEDIVGIFKTVEGDVSSVASYISKILTAAQVFNNKNPESFEQGVVDGIARAKIIGQTIITPINNL